MMCPQTIQFNSERAARRAAREHLEPYVVFDEAEVARMQRFPFPFLGSYVPKGWEKTGELFVDMSGLGADDEPAFSQRQLRAKLMELVGQDDTYGFAVTEAGQFQCYVGVYRQVEPKAPRRPRKAPKATSKDVWPKGEGA